MNVCICGSHYVPGNSDDEKAHADCHKTYLSGPEIPLIDQLSPISKTDGISIYVIDKTCSEQIRYDLNTVTKVAKQSMPQYPMGYDHTFTVGDQRLFIAAIKTRVVAMVLTCTSEDVQNITMRCIWESGGAFRMEKESLKTDEQYRVARVWTAKESRHKGTAYELIKAASEVLSCNFVDFAWDLPLTKEGEKLLKRLCPEFFWGCGNLYTMEKLIKEKSGSSNRPV